MCEATQLSVILIVLQMCRYKKWTPVCYNLTKAAVLFKILDMQTLKQKLTSLLQQRHYYNPEFCLLIFMKYTASRPLCGLQYVNILNLVSKSQYNWHLVFAFRLTEHKLRSNKNKSNQVQPTVKFVSGSSDHTLWNIKNVTFCFWL